MLRKWLCQADVTLHLKPQDPVLVKSGYATVDGPDMVPVRTYKDGKDVPYFPGSSLKGVLRSHLERIARSLRPRSVCLPYYEKPGKPDLPVAEERESYGCGFRSREGQNEDTTAEAYSDSCAACRLFGSLKFAGRFSIGDAYPVAKYEIVHRNGVGIDRFTGGTVPHVLFDLTVVVGGTFETKVRLVNFELWQLAALNFLLADLQDEMVPIGSGRSRSLGRVQGEVKEYRLSYVQPQTAVQGLAGLVSEGEGEEYGFHRWTPEPPLELPAPGRQGLRHVHDLTADWQARLQELAPAFEDFLKWHGGPRGEISREEAAAGK
jgi:CRISPR-associated RAMP protein (TIGR02581 family)